MVGSVLLLAGGWATSNHIYMQHFHRGCPILAFIARVVGDETPDKVKEMPLLYDFCMAVMETSS
jgi:hypothetical protein